MYNQIKKIGIEVSDMQAALDFYAGKLGMKIMERFPQENGDEYVFLDAGTLILELMPPSGGAGPLHHIAIGVDDTDRALNYFAQQGVLITMGHTVVENAIHLADVSGPDELRVRLFRREEQA